MNILLVGQDLDELRPYLAEFGLVEADPPEVIVTHGGDGTLIGAEREYPRIPKLPIRRGHACRKCARHEPRETFRRLTNEEIGRTHFQKIEVRVGDRMRKLAMNEVGLHMQNPASAVRFRLRVNGQPYVPGDIIGDGLVVATPFGATAYFRSITRGTFKRGIGLAIVNSVNPVEWAVLEPEDTVAVEIVRGPAIVLADNDPDQTVLETGDTLQFQFATEPAVVLGIDALRCPDCEKIDHDSE